MLSQDQYDKYDLLLPSKLDGGLLILALYQKIKDKELDEQFTINDIKETLVEIGDKYEGQSTPQIERLLRILLHYYLSNNATAPGKYYLTDYAKSIVGLVNNRVDNPYKNFKLKSSFEKAFIIKPQQINSADDLEIRFGHNFIAGSKEIIYHHLEAFNDELRAAYTQLAEILKADELNAANMVNNFTTVFRKFGEKAEDITNAIATKDRFLKDLQLIVDRFYNALEQFRPPDSEAGFSQLTALKTEWQRAVQVYNELEAFFKTVDYRIANIRRQINNASDKLSELHEHFTTRAVMRLQIKRLLDLALENAGYHETGVVFNANFPLKNVISKKTRFFFPEHYDFELTVQNELLQMQADKVYEKQKRHEIENKIMRQQVVAEWMEKAEARLNETESLELNDFMDEMIESGVDTSVVYEVVVGVVTHSSSLSGRVLNIEKKSIELSNKELVIWKMKLSNRMNMRF